MGAARTPKLALLLIDFQQKDRGYFTYEHGLLPEGIAKTVSVIASAKASGIPTIMVSGRLSKELFPEIASAAGENALRLHKRGIDAFKEPDLETYLNANDVDTLIIGGWVRHICVMATAREAINRGFSVMTSDEMLFGDRGMANLVARRTCLDFFRKNCILLDTSSELVSQIQKNGLRAL